MAEHEHWSLYGTDDEESLADPMPSEMVAWDCIAEAVARDGFR